MDIPAENVEANSPPAPDLAAHMTTAPASSLDNMGKSFAGAERRVLEHAADILRIPYETLVARSSATDSTSVSVPFNASNASNASNVILTPAESGGESNTRSTLAEVANSLPTASDPDLDPFADWIDFGYGSARYPGSPSSGAGVVPGRQQEPSDAYTFPSNLALPVRNSSSDSQRPNDGNAPGPEDPGAESQNALIGSVEDWQWDDEMFADMDINLENMPCSFSIDNAMDLSYLLPPAPMAGPAAPVAPSVVADASATSAMKSQPTGQRFAPITPTRAAGGQGVQKSSVAKKRGVRGPFKSNEERFETSLTRQLGACIRCTKQKTRCIRDPDNPDGECLTCKRFTAPRLVHYPCLRKRLVDTSFMPAKSDPGLYWTRRWTSMDLTDIEDWASPEVKMVELTQGNGSRRLGFRVREFVPHDGDALERTWLSKQTGGRHYHPVTPYALVSMKETGEYLSESLQRDTEIAIREFVDRSREERELLRDVLKLWVMARIQTRESRICGHETIGIQPQMKDPSRHDYGQFPVPPVISAQIAIIAEAMFFRPLQTQIRKRLDRLIGTKKPGAWLTIYLVCMLLLHNCALITEYYHSKAKNLRLSQRYAASDLLSDLHGSANILLTYYHCCVKANVPFAAGWKSAQDIEAAKLSKEQVDFLVWSNRQSRNMDLEPETRLCQWRVPLSQHILHALEHWSRSEQNFEEEYTALPFGSYIAVETICADQARVRMHLVPQYGTEREWMSAQELAELWSQPGTSTVVHWPEIIDLQELQLIAQPHEAISIVQIPKRRASGEATTFFVFKSVLYDLRCMYHELWRLLTLAPHPNMVGRPLFIVTTRSRFGAKEGVCGFVLEYVPGGTIRDLLVRSRTNRRVVGDGRPQLRLRLTDKFRIAREITSALLHLQALGTFHSGIKYTNIVMRDRGSGASGEDDKKDNPGLPTLCPVLIDFDHPAGRYIWTPPEVHHSRHVEYLANASDAGHMYVPEEIRTRAANLMRAHFPTWQPEKTARKRGYRSCWDHGEPLNGFSAPWLALSPEERDRAQVYMLGRLLWHLFEEVGAIDHCLHIEMFREACDFDVARPVFPEFNEERDSDGHTLTPEPIRRLIQRCTAGAPEWQGKKSPLVYRQGRLWARDSEKKFAGAGQQSGAEQAAQQAIRSWWVDELQGAERFILARRQEKLLPASRSAAAKQSDRLLADMKSRPLLQEVSETLEQEEVLVKSDRSGE